MSISSSTVSTLSIEAMQGLILGHKAVNSWSSSRALAAGSESSEVPETVIATVDIGSDIINQGLTVAGIAYRLRLEWLTGVSLLAFRTIWLYAYSSLQRHHAVVLQTCVKVARALAPLTMMAAAGVLAASMLAGHWMYVAGCCTTLALGVAVEKGWVAGRWARLAEVCLTCLNVANHFLQGEWLWAGLIVLERSLAIYARFCANYLMEGRRACFIDDNKAHVKAVLTAYTDGTLRDLQRSLMDNLSISAEGMKANYHELLEPPAESPKPEEWRHFMWPAWLYGGDVGSHEHEGVSDQEKEDWHHQMQGALQQQNPGNINEQELATLEGCWAKFEGLLSTGLDKIRHHESNGGALLDWVPVENAAQLLLYRLSVAGTQQERDSLRGALCEAVAGMRLCGTGLELSLHNACLQLQGVVPLEARIHNDAAMVRQAVVDEAVLAALKANIILRQSYGETGVHLHGDVAVSHPELNLANLPAALRDAQRDAQEGKFLETLILNWHLDLSGVYSVEKLIYGVCFQEELRQHRQEPSLAMQWVTARQEMLGEDLSYQLALDAAGLNPGANHGDLIWALSVAMLLDVGLLESSGDLSGLCGYSGSALAC